MNSLSALAEVISSDEENEDMKDILSNLCEGDVVRFCAKLTKQNFPGRITGIRRNGHDEVEEIDIEHLDAKLNGRIVSYAPGNLL